MTHLAHRHVDVALLVTLVRLTFRRVLVCVCVVCVCGVCVCECVSQCTCVCVGVCVSTNCGTATN